MFVASAPATSPRGWTMSRIRTVKPELFKHEVLYELEESTGLPVRTAFIGLFTVCDRDGRFKWRPRPLKLDILPYDSLDFSRVLDALASRGIIVKYASEKGELYGYIPSWHEHQSINNREADSVLPDPSKMGQTSMFLTDEPRVDHASHTEPVPVPVEGKGREGKGKEGKGVASADASAAKRGTRLNEETLPEEWLTWAVKNTPGLNYERVFQKFRNHWLSASGQKGVKLDWFATWRNWAMKDYDDNPKNKKDTKHGHFAEQDYTAGTEGFTKPGAAK